jgi:hypothetical protein
MELPLLDEFREPGSCSDGRRDANTEPADALRNTCASAGMMPAAASGTPRGSNVAHSGSVVASFDLRYTNSHHKHDNLRRRTAIESAVESPLTGAGTASAGSTATLRAVRVTDRRVSTSAVARVVTAARLERVGSGLSALALTSEPVSSVSSSSSCFSDARRRAGVAARLRLSLPPSSLPRCLALGCASSSSPSPSTLVSTRRPAICTHARGVALALGSTAPIVPKRRSAQVRLHK